MKRMCTVAVLFLLVVVPTGAMSAYDEALASSYQKFFEPFSEGATAKSLQMVPVPDFVKALQKGEPWVVLDVRTPAESGIYGITLPGTLAIPMDQVFKPENLARIPTDQKVAVVCKGGHRATAIAFALRHVGYPNVFVLKGGAEALAGFLTPKNAY